MWAVITEPSCCLPCCCHPISPTDVVWKAQQKNLNAGDAFDWYIDKQGRACLANALDLSIEQGVMSYAIPELFDMDSPECDPLKLGVAPARWCRHVLPGRAPARQLMRLCTKPSRSPVVRM